MEYEVQDLGVDHEQYFPGVGVAFTKWDAVYSGIGDTLREAIEDALECAATNDVDTTFIDGEAGFDAADLDAPLPDDAGDEAHHYAAVFVLEE